MTPKEFENVKKIIYTKMAMSINARNIKTDDVDELELALRKTSDFTQNEMDIIFGKKDDGYYEKIERDRKIKLGLIEEPNSKNEQEAAAYLKVQARKKEKELEDILGQAGI
jgi:hypothetical protein